MIEIYVLASKMYAYRMDDGSEKKSQGNKKNMIKNRVRFEDYKDCLFNNKIIQKSQLRFKSDHHETYTE